MRLVKVNRGIHFSASAHFEPYISNNTAKRNQFKHDPVLKAFYKLMNNAVFGKCIGDSVASL